MANFAINLKNIDKVGVANGQNAVFEIFYISLSAERFYKSANFFGIVFLIIHIELGNNNLNNKIHKHGKDKADKKKISDTSAVPKKIENRSERAEPYANIHKRSNKVPHAADKNKAGKNQRIIEKQKNKEQGIISENHGQNTRK